MSRIVLRVTCAACLVCWLGAAGATASFRPGSVEYSCDTQHIGSDTTASGTTYRANGGCTSRNAAAFAWSATGGYNPTTKETKEVVTLPPPSVNEPTPQNRPYGRYRITMICEKDPWLAAPGTVRCTQPTASASGNVTDADLLRLLANTGLPFSAAMRPDQRLALIDAERRAATIKAPTTGPLAGQSTTAQTAALQPSPATTLNQARASGGATLSTPTAPSAATTLNAARASGSTVSSPVATAPAATAAPAPSTGTVDAAQRLQQALVLQRQQQNAQAAAATQPPANSAPAATPPTTTPPTAPPQPNPTAAAPAAVLSAPVAAALAPPRIVAPGFDGKVIHGARLEVKVQPPPGAERGMAEIEIRPAPGSGAAPGKGARRFNAPMEQLARGMPVPANALPAAPGRWQVRARMTGGDESAWSGPVPFEVVAAGEPLAQTPGAIERQGLNPQPLPPKAHAGGAAKAMEQRGLNPQPLPPREAPAASTFKRDNATDVQRAFGGPMQNRLQP